MEIGSAQSKKAVHERHGVVSVNLVFQTKGHTMKKFINNVKTGVLIFVIAIILPLVSFSEDGNKNLQQEISALKQEVNALKKEVQSKSKPDKNFSSVARKKTINQPTSQNSNNNITSITQNLTRKWVNANSVVHLSGYADTGFIATQHERSRFFLGHFNPIFHYLYKNLILAESEVELEVNSHGETEVKLEYADLGLFLNNYMILIVGKFISPLGFFFQNIHPTWINKLPTSPPGFKGDQAAPEADIGVELRGGFHIDNPTRVNYAVYVANGPKAIVEDGEIEEIETEGFNADADGNKIVGGRIGILPIPNLEIGISGAIGKVGLFGEDPGEAVETNRNYNVLGADASLQVKNLELRGEIIQQDIKSHYGSDISGGKWRGWYGQASYRFRPTKLEGIVRYGDYRTPHADQDLKQWALGCDYWFAPSAVAKVAYEFNSGLHGTANNANSLLFQLAYGF